MLSKPMPNETASHSTIAASGSSCRRPVTQSARLPYRSPLDCELHRAIGAFPDSQTGSLRYGSLADCATSAALRHVLIHDANVEFRYLFFSNHLIGCCIVAKCMSKRFVSAAFLALGFVLSARG